MARMTTALRASLFLLVGIVPACGGAPSGDGPLVGNTLTLRAQWMLMPGEERYQCFVTRWSRAGGIRVQSIEPHVGSGVHHVGVFTDDYHTEHQDTRECKDMGLWGFVYGAGVGTGVLQFPAGTARTVDDQVSLILQMHYLNATNAPVDSVSTVDLQLDSASANLAEVGTWILGTTNIDLPPHQHTDVDSMCATHPSFEHVFAVFPHMHRLGEALNIAAGAGASVPVVDVPQWNFSQQGMFPVEPAMRIDASSPLRTRCSYQNNSDSDVHFGLSTGDEMCVGVLYYWPSAAPPSLMLCG
jgi:hypothetical protein